MARAGRKDRGLVSRIDATGKLAWYVRLYVDGRERRFGAFKNKTAARDFYDRSKQEQRDGRFIPEHYQKGGAELIATFIDRYLTTIGNKKSQQDERRFGAWWKTWFNGQRLPAITPGVLEDARQYLLSERTPVRTLKNPRRACHVKKPRLLAGGVPKRHGATVNRYFQWLRKVLNLAVRDGKLQANPVCRLKLAKESKGKTRFLAPDEEVKLMAALGPIHASWARLAILTGMRQTEQFSLKWGDVGLARGFITLPTTKAGDIQYVTLNEEAKQILQGLTIGNRSVWVFPSKNLLTHLDPRNFYDRRWIPAVKKAGIEWVTWHDLRHTFASRLAMAGHNEGTIAALLRHSTTALVKRYAHLSPSHLHAAVESVAAFGKGREGAESPPSAGAHMTTFSNGTVTETGKREAAEEGAHTEVVEKVGAPGLN